MMNILLAHTILGISDLLFWGIVIAIAVIAELATLNLVSIWFIFGAIVSLVASFLGASVALQFALFIVLSGIGFLVFFFVIKPKLANRDVELGISPRATLMLLQAAKARALLEGRGFVVPDDVQQLFQPVLQHRLLIRAEGRVQGIDSAQILEVVLRQVPVPTRQ
jgi:membrane protein implicated in regulation of membrane protease activity